jgi:hypothetical protein
MTFGGLAASTQDGIWLGTYENGPARLFHFTAATLARLLDGETLAASQAATVLTIPDHAQGAAIEPIEGAPTPIAARDP